MFGKALWGEKRRLLKSKGNSYQRQWFLDKVLFSGILRYLQMQIVLWCRWETSSSGEPYTDSHIFSCRGGRGQSVLSSPDRLWVSRRFPAGGTAKFFNKSEFCELGVLNRLVILSEWKTQTMGTISLSQQHALQRHKGACVWSFIRWKSRGKRNEMSRLVLVSSAEYFRARISEQMDNPGSNFLSRRQLQNLSTF